MPAYSFQAQFAPLVESGEKRQTIRAIGKRRHARPGERLQLYTGMRTKGCRKLVNPDPICKSVHSIYIYKISELRREGDFYQMWMDGKIVFKHEAAEMARADGFRDRTAFFNFFEDTHGMPFKGVLIRW